MISRKKTQKNNSFLRFLRLFAAIIATLFTTLARADVKLTNGGFENKRKPLAGWRVRADGGAVEPVRIGGQWFKVKVTFNSAECDRVNLYIGAYSTPTGSCWIDNVRGDGFEIKNPSFEQMRNGAYTHWSHEGPGKWTHVSTEHASDGKHALKILDASFARQMIRATQVVRVKPQTDYSYSFDFYMADDFTGAIRSSAITPPDKPYRVLGGITHVNGIAGGNIDDYIADRSAAGPQQCQFKLDGGTVSIAQRKVVTAAHHYEAGASIKVIDLQGKLTLMVNDAKSRRVFAETTIDDTGGLWRDVRLPFVAQSGFVEVRISGEGNGKALIDNTYLSAPVLRPAVQSVEWRKAADGFALGDTLTWSIHGPSGDVLQTGLSMLGDDLNMKVTPGDDAALKIDTTDNTLSRGEEAYRLEVTGKAIHISAASERGAFHGLMTLLQLISRDSNGKPIIIGCKIDDWPDLPQRGLNRGTAGLTPQWMARRKANMAFHINVQDIDAFRRHGIEAIPHDNITHYPYNNPTMPDILRDPNYAEGRGRTDELVLQGDKPAELTGRNVLRTKLTDIVVTSADGKATFQEDRDYRVIPGELKMSTRQPTSFLPDAKPFAIARIASGRIADGATVKATYEHAGHNHFEMCLAELTPQTIVAQRAANQVRDYKLAYIGLYVSESPACVGKGPRCRATGLSPSQLLVRYYQRLDAAIKQANPNCRMRLFTDDFLPWQHLPRSGLDDVLAHVPKDAILDHWHYNSGDSVQFAYKTAKLSAEHGLEFILIPFYDYRNIHVFAAAAKWARDRGMGCVGMSDWAYHLGPYKKLTQPAPFIERSLSVAWRVPREGEYGHVDFEAELKALKLE